jgi:hypothetical protein
VISSTTATTATAAPAKLKPAGTLTFGKAKAKETKEVKKLEEPPKVEPPLVKVEKAVVIPTESNAGSSSKRQDSLMVPQVSNLPTIHRQRTHHGYSGVKNVNRKPKPMTPTTSRVKRSHSSKHPPRLPRCVTPTGTLV